MKIFKTLLISLWFVVSMMIISPAFSQGLHFDGIDDYVDLGAWNAPTTLTLEAWVKLDDLTGSHVIVSQYNVWATEASYMLSIFDGEPTFLVSEGDDFTAITIGSMQILNIGEWYHIAASYDGSTARLYINGLLDSEMSGSISMFQTGTVNHYIGASQGAGEYFAGTIDEVRIWSVARTNCQIQQAMFTQLAGTETSLLSYYNFNEGVEGGDNTALASVNDLTATHTGTLTNFTLNGASSNWISSTNNIAGTGAFADTFKPVADIEILDDITAECEVTSLTAPTATDVCAGTITVTHNATLPITTVGLTEVTWSYDDGNGNIATQIQNVIISDITDPTITCVADTTIVLPEFDTIYVVGGTELDPLIVDDNCSIASLLNDFNGTDTLKLDTLAMGNHTVTWMVIDGNGNTANCATLIDIVEYMPPPCTTDPVLNGISFDITDACAGDSVTLTINGTLNDAHSWYLFHGPDTTMFDVLVGNTYKYLPDDTTTIYVYPNADCMVMSIAEPLSATVNVSPLPVAHTNHVAHVCEGEEVTLEPQITEPGVNYTWTGGAVNGIPFAVFTSEMFYLNAELNGCIATDSTFIDVKPHVTHTVDTSVCLGETIVMEGISISKDTTFTKVFAGPFVCDSTVTYNVVLKTLPTVLITESYPTAVCSGSMVTLTATGAQSYQWSNGIENGIAFNIDNTTTFNVTATDVNNCSVSESITIDVAKLDAHTTVVWDSADFTCPGHNAVFDIHMPQSSMFFYLTISDSVVNGPVRGKYGYITLTDSAVMENSHYSIYASPDSVVNTDLTTIGCTSLVDSVFVNFKPLISFTEHPADYENCEGQLIKLSYTAEGTADTLMWEKSNDGINFTTLDLASAMVDSTNADTTTLWLNSTNTINNNIWFRVAAENCGTFIYTDAALITLHSLPEVIAGNSEVFCEGTAFTFLATGADSIAWNNNVYNDSTYVITQSSDYIVTGISAEGCVNTDTLTITVNEIHTLNNKHYICYGDSIMVGDSVYKETGVYENILISSTGCDSIIYSHLTVYSLPNIHAGQNADYYVCEGAEVTLLAHGGVEYVWNNGVTDGEAFTPLSTTTYTVTGTDENGCVSNDSVRVTVQTAPENKQITGLSMNCYGDEPTVELNNAQPNVLYYLSNASTDKIVDGPLFADNATLTFNAGVINQPTSFNVKAHNINSDSKAYKFNGLSNYVTIPNATQLNMSSGEITIEAWILVDKDNPVTKAGIISSAIGLNDVLFKGWQIKLDNNKVTAQISDSTSLVSLNSSTSVNDVQWHHLALVINTTANNAALYIDGVKEADVTNVAINRNIANTNEIILGTDKTKKEFTGLTIDELKLWSKAKSNTEISSNRYHMLAGYEADLTAYYKFDAESGLTVNDGTNFANHGYANTDTTNNHVFGLLSLNGCMMQMSTTLVFDVHSDIEFTQQPTANAACYGSDITMNYAIAGSPDSLVWYAMANNTTSWIAVQTDINQGTFVINNATNELNGNKYLVKAYMCGDVITESDIVTIQVNHPISTSVSHDETSLMANMLGAAYQWLNCDSNMVSIAGATNQLFTPALSGNYAVAITDDACTDTSDCYYFSTEGDHLDKEAEITSINLSESVICPNETVTITVNGTLNTATYWAIYTNGCASVLVDTSKAGIFEVTPDEYTTYFVRGESPDMQWASCTEVVVDVAPLPYLHAGHDATVCEGESVTLEAVCNGTFTWDNNWENGHTFVPTENMTLHVTTQNQHGCTATDSMQIHLVYPVSYSQSIELKLGEVVHVGESFYTSAGTYTDVLTSALGCDSTVTTTVSMLPMAEVEACEPFELIIPASVFEGVNMANATFTATLANGDPLPHWLTFNAQTLTFSGEAPCNGEIYEILVTANDGRKTIVTYQFTIETSTYTSINSNIINGIKLYPNPSKGIFKLELNTEMVNKVMVRNLSGRILMVREKVANHTEFNLSNYPSGTYLIQVINNNKISFIKLIKL